MFSMIEVWFGRGGCVIRGLVAGSPVATCRSPNYSLIRPRVCLNNIIRIRIFFAIVVPLFQSGLARKPELSEWENRAASSSSNREFVYRFCACLVCLMVYGEWNTKKLKLYIFSKKKQNKKIMLIRVQSVELRARGLCGEVESILNSSVGCVSGLVPYVWKTITSRIVSGARNKKATEKSGSISDEGTREKKRRKRGKKVVKH